MGKGTQKTLIILGMHRSGTSLITNWLHKKGLNLGSNILGPGTGNKFGHFEDLEIMKFHKDILMKNGLHHYLIEKEVPSNIIQKEDLDKAKAIIKSRNTQVWGWKEPRTCLFVNNLWSGLLSNSKYLIVFRDYKEVVISLLEREFKFIISPVKRFIISPKAIGKALFLFIKIPYNIQIYKKTWITYNLELLKLCNSISLEDYLVTTPRKMTTEYAKVDSVLSREWGICLNKVDYNKIYNRKSLSRYFFKKLIYSSKAEKIIDNLWLKKEQSDSYFDSTLEGGQVD